MHNPNSEILLISIEKEPATGEYYSLRRFGGRFAPLGLLCLAATAPDRIAVINSSNGTQLSEYLQDFSNPKAIIIQGGDNPTDKINVDTLSELRERFPGARIGISDPGGAHREPFDFTVTRTGKTAVLRILRGEIPTGIFDELPGERFDTLDIPEEPMLDGDYESHPEKWLAGRTIEVFQPWLGLLDRSESIFSWPGIDWVAKLVSWLNLSGYNAVHFRPSGLTPTNLHELRSVMLNLNMPFAASFKIREDQHFTRIGAPLRQIWLYHPAPETAHICLDQLARIKAADCQPGLQLNRNSIGTATEPDLLATAERICLDNLHCWALSDLKRVMARFWRRRFFSRLAGLRSAGELIMFMKTSYNILDILLS
ncbi:MAG: hypothetical protein GQF41_1742 [Candidatus Rifleibacterium amylolyticum]|nr:MAG: hypothetical protein GQF41_1742 [Candidatus Rifleibacterium amylolyticum]